MEVKNGSNFLNKQKLTSCQSGVLFELLNQAEAVLQICKRLPSVIYVSEAVPLDKVFNL